MFVIGSQHNIRCCVICCGFFLTFPVWSELEKNKSYFLFSLRAKFMEIKSALKLKVNSAMEMKSLKKEKKTLHTWKANRSIIKAGWRVQGASAASGLMRATSLCRCSIMPSFETLHVIMGSKKPTVTRGDASAAAFLTEFIHCIHVLCGNCRYQFFVFFPIQIHECTWIRRWINVSRLALHALRCVHFAQTFKTFR